ncbi:MAG: metal ABC transporter ATP-binding protein [Rhodospirillaceae bacterium]|nr:metal ABC transporter ATP-binding protein [Rhodospirillaceae bacterium]
MPDGGNPIGEVLVRGTGISVRHGRRTVLHNVDIQVSRGEIVTLIGPNGSGKTTLVRALLELESPESGQVQKTAGITVGYTPQQLTVDRTLPLDVRRFLEMSGVTDPEVLSNILADVGARNVLRQEIRMLSGGEMKRVLLARALLREPDLLVLDEPTANVDVHGQVEFYELIRRIRDERQCGILLVSHDLHLVMSATDRVVCLNGHVCCSGLPGDVSTDPAYLELFGEAASAVAVYAHDHDHHHA